MQLLINSDNLIHGHSHQSAGRRSYKLTHAVNDGVRLNSPIRLGFAAEFGIHALADKAGNLRSVLGQLLARLSEPVLFAGYVFGPLWAWLQYW